MVIVTKELTPCHLKEIIKNKVEKETFKSFDISSDINTSALESAPIKFIQIQIRNKSENFTGMISEYVDAIVIAETKLDDTFPNSQFSLPGFKAPIRLDCTAFFGGLLVLISERITSKNSNARTVPRDIQAVPIELNINNSKWLFLPTYKPPYQKETYLLDKIQKVVDFYANQCKVYCLEIST